MRASWFKKTEDGETMLVTIPEGARPGDDLTITTSTGQDWAF